MRARTLRTIGVVTTSRADYGYYRPLLHRIREDPELELQLFVTGMHLAPEFGLTVRDIEADGFPIAERVEMLLASDTPEAIAKSMGLGTIGFAQAFARTRPDILVLLGDRFEMHAAAVASLSSAIPLAHIGGGDSTEGAFDESLRHSITKMSHLHFASRKHYAERIIQMGEEPWRVTISGAPSLDNLRDLAWLSRSELEARFGLDLEAPPLLVTYHPVTLEYEATESQVTELLAALDKVGGPVVFTYPNADTWGRIICRLIEGYVISHANARVVVNLGPRAYFSLLNHCVAMVGNSSSGIIEAASFRLPVVNIGNRQRGRLHGPNVVDVGYDRDAIVGGIRKALEPRFRALLADLVNSYGDGHASERIVAVLKQVSLEKILTLKRFHEMTAG